MKLLEYLEPTNIALHLTGESKDEVLSALVAVLVGQGSITHSEPLLGALREREGLGSTGIGHGVAIPHARSKEVSRPVVVFGRSDAEVNFDSIDGKVARLFFLLVAPENGVNEHLHLLAKIARLMRDASTREKLLLLDSPADVLELLGQHDAD